eukprot:TRINITY_DN11780_c0_g1_i20.p1 TRINITY_DN11780_c0_g1~~TRINITY_DN11780_c0_g1_i20.p1  ORF type:complete len:314 (+),score=94.08 TRINITY_DN11780_c0_g1_i20:112-1053(+)
MAVYYYYDVRGNWRCERHGGAGVARRAGGRWRLRSDGCRDAFGEDEDWRVRQEVDEFKVRSKVELLEAKLGEMNGMKKMLEEEACWRWWAEWRIRSLELAIERMAEGINEKAMDKDKGCDEYLKEVGGKIEVVLKNFCSAGLQTIGEAAKRREKARRKKRKKMRRRHVGTIETAQYNGERSRGEEWSDSGDEKSHVRQFSGIAVENGTMVEPAAGEIRSGSCDSILFSGTAVENGTLAGDMAEYAEKSENELMDDDCMTDMHIVFEGGDIAAQVAEETEVKSSDVCRRPGRCDQGLVKHGWVPRRATATRGVG